MIKTRPRRKAVETVTIASGAVPGPVFELFRDRKGQWRYRLRGGNGEIMCQSEGYASMSKAARGAHDLADAARLASMQPCSTPRP